MSDQQDEPEHFSEYWDTVAPNYDELYSDSWSALENAKVARAISKHIPLSDGDRVLDLGCGTGLGFDLIARADLGLFGVDISPGMLAICQAKHPGATLVVGNFEIHGNLPQGPYSLVSMFFSVGSYAKDLSALLSSVGGLLLPGGHVYMSVLNRWSLRRVFRLRFVRVERYRTRKDRSGTAVPTVTTYSMRGLRRQLDALGYEVTWAGTGSVLAGVFEKPRLWTVAEKLSVVFPWCAHTFEIIARLPDAPASSAR